MPQSGEDTKPCEGQVSDLKCVLSAACFAEQMREDSAHSLPRSSGAGVSCRGT